MQDLNDMLYFAEVVEADGFAAAARRLGVPKSKISRRVAELEGRLGVRLLHRTTRRVKLTEVGATYLEDCRRILAELEEALETGSLIDLVQRFEERRFSTRDVLALIVAGLRGGGWQGTAADLLRVEIGGGPVEAARAAAELLARAFSLPGEAPGEP